MTRDDGPQFDPRWEPEVPFERYELAEDDDWERLRLKYARQPAGSDAGTRESLTDRPLNRCLEVARLAGAMTAIVEFRYIDIDYRSEYSSFYSRAFATHEDSTHRIHFFATKIGEDEVTSLPEVPGYLGYMIIRPQVRGVIGRTMLAWPGALAGAIRTGVRERVSFFGQDLTVRAVPFMQQEARLGSCAQVAAWMCHYSAFRGARGIERRQVADFSDHADPQLAPGRLVPSSGLNLQQLSAIMHSFGLPSLYYRIESLGDSDRPDNWPARGTATTPRARQEQAALRAACRYLNSALPVIGLVAHWVDGAPASALHAMVACGYRRTSDGVTLIVHDDRRGPYLPVEALSVQTDAESGEHSKWEQILAPVPSKLWLSGDAAERHGCSLLLAGARKASEAGIVAAESVMEAHSRGDLTVRTYAIASNVYKRRLRERADDSVLIEHISLARLPRWVWVVEAVDRVKRDEARREQGTARSASCVLAEIVFDGTSDDRSPNILACRLPGLLAVPKPWNPFWDIECQTTALPTGGQYEP